MGLMTPAHTLLYAGLRLQLQLRQDRGLVLRPEQFSVQWVRGRNHSSIFFENYKHVYWDYFKEKFLNRSCDKHEPVGE